MNDREIVAYCRVSTQEQGINGLGMAAQRHAVTRFAAAFGCIVVATYEEVETACKDRLDNRPQLVKAVAHAKRSGALLVIARIDRLARSVLVTSQLLASGVEFIACDNPHANRLTIHILAAMAEHEGRLISERTKAGLAAARERGVKFGNGGQYLTAEARHKGQQAAKIAHVRRAREAYADLVPLMRELREAGGSIRDIAAHLNEMGHRNQRKHAWSISNVRAVFIREGLCHLTNTFSLQNNITPEIQRLGAHASGVLANVAAKAAYANITPFVLECYAATESLRSIAERLNALGHRTQRWGFFGVSTVRGILVRAGIPKPHIGRFVFSAEHKAAAIVAARAAKLRRAREHRAKHLPFAQKRRSDGLTLRHIATEMNRRGRRTSRGCKWSDATVWVLLNVSYE